MASPKSRSNPPGAPEKRRRGRPTNAELEARLLAAGSTGPKITPEAINDLGASIRAIINLEAQPAPGAQATLGAQPGPGAQAAPGPQFAAPPSIILDKLWSGVFRFIAVRGGDHWRSTAEESAWLGATSHDAIVRYAPLINKHAELFALGTALVIVLGTKILATVEIAERTKQKQPKPKPKEGDQTHETRKATGPVQ